MEWIPETSNDINVLIRFLPLIAQFIFMVAWFVRLESRLRFQEETMKIESEARKMADKDIKETAEKQVLTVWAKIDSMNVSIVKILQSTARLETALGLKPKE